MACGVTIFITLTVTAGYDVSTRESYEETIRSFNDTVGLKFLKGMHINDSKCGHTASIPYLFLSLAASGLLQLIACIIRSLICWQIVLMFSAFWSSPAWVVTLVACYRAKCLGACPSQVSGLPTSRSLCFAMLVLAVLCVRFQSLSLCCVDAVQDVTCAAAREAWQIKCRAWQ